MKNALRTPFLLLLTVLVATLLVPAPSAAQDRHEEFKKKFRQAMGINSRDEMAKLVREHQDEAVWLIVGTCESIAARPSDELETLIDALRKAWTQAVNTTFVDQVYEYYSLLDPVLKREQQQLAEKFKRAQTKMFELVEKKDGPGLEILGHELGGMADGFDQVGDKYYASQTWMLYGNCFDEGYRGGDANLKKATQGFGKALELRKAIGLEDQNYRLTKVRYDQLVAQGYNEPDRAEEEPVVSDPGAPVPPGSVDPSGNAPAAPTAALEASLEFDLLETLDEVERPNYSADDFYQMWSALGFGEKGSLARFQSIKEGPSFVRAGASDVRWDADGDAAADDDDDSKLPLTGNLTPFEVEIGQGDEARRWAFMIITGLEKDQYQYVGEINLAPSDTQMTLYTINAGSMVGDLAGTAVRVIDDNMDGIYGSPPLSWGYAGLSRDMFQPDMDSIVVGSGKRALPWSEYQLIGGLWYKLEPQRGGKSITATPVQLATGKLQLDFKGGKPTWLVVKGDGKYENCYFDLGAGKAVDVPVGRYTLFCGELRKGKKSQATKSLILPGKRTPSFSVAAGETTKVELGAPFGFDFRFTKGADKVTVEGASVVVTGKADERYERVWGAVPRPEVSWRKAGAKRGSKGEQMDVVMDIDGIGKHGFSGAWAPLDITLEVNGVDEGEKIELQLVEEKNELFGGIESAWKE